MENKPRYRIIDLNQIQLLYDVYRERESKSAINKDYPTAERYAVGAGEMDNLLDLFSDTGKTLEVLRDVYEEGHDSFERDDNEGEKDNYLKYLIQ